MLIIWPRNLYIVQLPVVTTYYILSYNSTERSVTVKNKKSNNPLEISNPLRALIILHSYYKEVAILQN